MQFSRQQSNNGQEAAFPFFKEGRVHKGQQYEAGCQRDLDFSRMELWRYAKTHGDLETWAAFQQGLEETVLSWFHEHPASEVVRRVQSDKHFVARAFERLWQAVVQRQVACETLSGVLVYLRACLNGAILETLRVSRRPGADSSLWLDGEDCPDRSTVWDRLQAVLSGERERRLAYLLYHCGLKPAEIVRGSPQEWSNVHEVARLRRSILERLMMGLNFEGQTIV